MQVPILMVREMEYKMALWQVSRSGWGENMDEVARSESFVASFAVYLFAMSDCRLL